MKKVKHILAIFFHSVLPQDIYYPKLLHTKFQFSLKYYLTVILFFALLFTGIVLYQFSPSKLVSYKDSIVNALSSFPEETSITIKNGILESNQNKPLFLWVYHENQPIFVFMIHTKDVLKSTYIPLPLIFLGNDKTQISYKGYFVLRTYNNSWNILITKSTLHPFISYINSYFFSFIFFFYLFLILLVPITFVVWSSTLILLSSLFVYILLYTFIPHIHLKKCIQAGMHGTHIPFFILILLTSLFPTATSSIIITSSLVFVFSLVATYEMYSKEVPAHKKK